VRKFWDIETGEVITEDELRAIFRDLKEDHPGEYGGISFNRYVLNCLDCCLEEITEED